VPADRFFGAAPEVLGTLKARVGGNALELARNGLPKAPFYLTGQVGGKPFSLHAEGERVFLTGVAGARQEIDLAPPPADDDHHASSPIIQMPEPVCPHWLVPGSELASAEPEPGPSPLDEGMRSIARGLKEGGVS